MIKKFSRTVVGNEIFLMGIVALFTMLTNKALLPALILGVFLFPLRYLAYGYLTRRSSWDLSVSLLLVMMPVSLWATALPDITCVSILRLSFGILMAYSVINWAFSPQRLFIISWGLTFAGLFLALIAPVSVKWFGAAKLPFIPADLYSLFPRLIPDTIHPNVMAGTLVLLLPFPLCLMLLGKHDFWPSVWGIPISKWRGWARLFLGFAVLAMLIILVLTKSRGGWIAGAAVLLLCMGIWKPRLWLAIPIMLSGLGILIYRFGVRAIDFLMTTQAFRGFEGRLEVWSRALYMLQDFPFTGIGMGTYNQVANVLYPFFLAGPDAEIPHAHNLYLQVAVDLGLPGLIAYMSILLLTAYSAWNSYRRFRDHPYLAACSWAVLTGLIGMCVHGILDAALWDSRPALFAWIVLGTAMALNNLNRVHHSPFPSNFQQGKKL